MVSVTECTGYVVATGRRLALVRERRGWSMGQLSDRSGVSRAAISRIESGTTPSPGAETLRKLSEALGVPLSELTGERPAPRRQIQIIEGAASVPVWRRRVHAGTESHWDDTQETVWVSRYLVAAHPRVACAIVTGDCMAPTVQPGQKVIFDPDANPQHRDMVVVTTDDGDMMLKWFRTDGENPPYLESADGARVRPNGGKIEGVVLTIQSESVRDPRP